MQMVSKLPKEIKRLVLKIVQRYYQNRIELTEKMNYVLRRSHMMKTV